MKSNTTDELPKMEFVRLEYFLVDLLEESAKPYVGQVIFFSVVGKISKYSDPFILGAGLHLSGYVGAPGGVTQGEDEQRECIFDTLPLFRGACLFPSSQEGFSNPFPPSAVKSNFCVLTTLSLFNVEHGVRENPTSLRKPHPRSNGQGL